MNPLVYTTPIFDPRYKLANPEHSLCDLLGDIHSSATALKVKEKVETLFNDYWQL